MSRSNEEYETIGLPIERVSTLPASIQQIYLTDNNSLDTFHLLTHSTSPQYANTSHIHISNVIQNSPSSSKREERGLQQVPQRFSKFIIDQSSKSRKFDNISLASSYIKDIDNRLRLKKSKRSDSSKLEKEGSLLLSNYSKDLAGTGGSQATIFSTRPDQDESMNAEVKSKSKSKLEKVKSNSSNLKRRKAIRNRFGGKVYRLHLRLKKLLKKIKSFRFQFRASSRKTGSISRSRSLNRGKKNKNNKIFPRNITQVSAPINNPNLGKDQVEFVDNLKDIQELAGKLQDINPNAEIKVSSFVGQKNPEGSSQNRNMEVNSIIPNSVKREVQTESESESVPPVTPPHGLGNHSNLDKNIERETLITLWRSYLSVIIQKRIQLRHEINLFQSLLIDQDKSRRLNTNFSRASSYTESSIYPSEEIDIHTKGSLFSYDTSSYNPDFDDEEPLINDFTEEFNKNYSNRRSILGDMLEYDSDDCSMITSISTLSASNDENQGTSIYQRKTYGTVSSRTRSEAISLNIRKLF